MIDSPVGKAQPVSIRKRVRACVSATLVSAGALPMFLVIHDVSPPDLPLEIWAFGCFSVAATIITAIYRGAIQSVGLWAILLLAAGVSRFAEDLVSGTAAFEIGLPLGLSCGYLLIWRQRWVLTVIIAGICVFAALIAQSSLVMTAAAGIIGGAVASEVVGKATKQMVDPLDRSAVGLLIVFTGVYCLVAVYFGSLYYLFHLSAGGFQGSGLTSELGYVHFLYESVLVQSSGHFSGIRPVTIATKLVHAFHSVVGVTLLVVYVGLLLARLPQIHPIRR